MKTEALATLFPPTKLAPILKRYMPAELPTAPLDPIASLVSSFLLWESSTTAAEQALIRVKAECVDFNELRVCLPEEITSMLGSRYPFAEERANRLRRSLNDIYRREHKVSLDHIAALGKREQRAYVENLDGMVPFVAGRLLLLHFGQPSVPIDDQLAELLREHKLIAKETSTTDLGHALSKHYHSVDEATKVHLAFIGYADAAWERDPKAMMKNKAARMSAQHAAERAARREAEKAAEAAAKLAEAAAKAEAERIEAAKVAARAQARADARARAAALRAAEQQAAAAAAKIKPGVGQSKVPPKGLTKPVPPTKKLAPSLPVKSDAKTPVKPGTQPILGKPALAKPASTKAPAKSGGKVHTKAPGKGSVKGPAKASGKDSGKTVVKRTAVGSAKRPTQVQPKVLTKGLVKKGMRK